MAKIATVPEPERSFVSPFPFNTELENMCDDKLLAKAFVHSRKKEIQLL